MKLDTLPKTVYIWLVCQLMISSGLCVAYIILEMNKDNADCGPLLEGTANALGEEAMQMLLISTQRTNLALCIKYAVKRYVNWYINSRTDLRH